MRGSRRVNRAPDSLDLLLDTICNAFGGILLIALLISLITQQTKITEADQASDVENQILEREIASYSTQIEKALAFLKNQSGTAPSAEYGPSNDDDVDGARIAVKKAQERANAAGDTPAGEPQDVQDKRQIDAALAAARVRISALEGQNDFLKGRLADLKGKIAESSQTLRLPKEQESRNGALWFILEHNEVFSKTVLVGGELGNNRGAFSGVWRPGEDVLRPIRGKGLRPEEVASAMGALLQTMRAENLYAAILLKEDSVPAFTALKEALVANGVSFGWEYHAGGIYEFTLEGGSRPPQL